MTQWFNNLNIVWQIILVLLAFEAIKQVLGTRQIIEILKEINKKLGGYDVKNKIR